MNSVVIVAAHRTAVGSFQGGLSTLPAPQLGAAVIREALKSSQLTGTDVSEVIMGQVLTAGAGQAPARQAAIYSGLASSVPCLTINKVCGSGLKAVMLGADSIRLDSAQIVVAGGQENMTLAPHLLENSRQGYRMGSQQMIDSMIKDGLWDPYNNWHMGNAAELCSREYKFSREAQDEFAVNSYKKAQAASAAGHFKNEITSITIKDRKGEVQFIEDEEPKNARFEKMPSLKPAFEKEGTITAANASKINDGAAALVLMSEAEAHRRGLKILAKISTYATFAQDPKWFTTAPVGAIKKALQTANWKPEDVDFWEVNEAFANVAMAAQKEFSISADRLNPHGGAIAIGHPIGASGARILTTLVHALLTHNKKRGIASLCIGGGEAVALGVETV